jgi:hypothetical protein
MAGTKDTSGYQWILAYGIVIMIISFIMKFKAGYTAIYYCLVLSCLLMFIIDSKFIIAGLAPLLPANGQSNTGPTGPVVTAL